MGKSKKELLAESVDFTGENVGEEIKKGTGEPERKEKRVRINMAFDSDVYDYIQSMTILYKLTYTQFVNKLIREKIDSDPAYKEINALRKRTLEEERKRTS